MFIGAICACYRYANEGVELAVHNSVTITCNGRIGICEMCHTPSLSSLLLKLWILQFTNCLTF